MLAFPKPTRVAHRLSLHAGALTPTTRNAGLSSLAAAAEHSSRDRPTAKDTKATVPQWRAELLAKSTAEYMFVYPWNGIRSSSEGLAIARALQDKYGPAKEVIFPRDPEYVSNFQPYFWLVFDNADVRKLLPKASERIKIQVADIPRSDGNVGLEEMMRGLGLSTNENTHDAPRESSTETAASEDASDTPSGYKTVALRVEWARYGPRGVLRRRKPVARSLPSKALLPQFAAAWLAFDGFSPESARGPNTPNLLRAREKWRKFASKTSSTVGYDDHSTATVTPTAGVTPSHDDPIDADTEPVETQLASTLETQTQNENVPPPREWIPIVPRNGQRPMPMLTSTPVAQKDDVSTSAPTPTPTSTSTPPSLDPARTADVLDATDSTKHDDGFAHTPRREATAPLSSPSAAVRMSRRDRILQLARQHARTPLPKFTEEQAKPPQTEAAEKVDGDEESERHVKERTIRERLWRLVGGNY